MMLVAIKPTVGRISRYGIMPLTADQDTAGPMARTVTDAAILLGALEQSVPDPNDPALTGCPQPADHDYRPYLERDGLKGARIGIPRALFCDPILLPGDRAPLGGLNPEQAKVMADAIAKSPGRSPRGCRRRACRRRRSARGRLRRPGRRARR